jgi:hypothetical protein
MPARRLLLTLAAALALPAAGCGFERTDPPDLATASPPTSFQPLSFPADGLTLRSPANWHVARGPAPLVAAIDSGRATLAVWRYERAETLPSTPAEIRKAVPALVARVRKRDPSARLDPPSVGRFAGAPGVMITGEQTIFGRRERLRSVHVFGQGAEVVLDAYAPPAQFARVDREVFGPVLGSLRIGPPAAGSK